MVKRPNGANWLFHGRLYKVPVAPGQWSSSIYHGEMSLPRRPGTALTAATAGVFAREPAGRARLGLFMQHLREATRSRTSSQRALASLLSRLLGPELREQGNVVMGLLVPSKRRLGSSLPTKPHQQHRWGTCRCHYCLQSPR